MKASGFYKTAAILAPVRERLQVYKILVTTLFGPGSDGIDLDLSDSGIKRFSRQVSKYSVQLIHVWTSSQIGAD